MMNRILAAALSWLVFMVTSAAAEVTAVRPLPLSGFGSLELAVPKSWQHNVLQPPDGLPPTLTLLPPTGNGFNVQITPIWAFRPQVLVPRKNEILPSIKREAERLRPDAVVNSVHVRELTGKAGSGHYFSATDKMPKPGEYKHLAQGMIHLGNVVVAFTILTNDGAEAALAQALEMMKEVRHVPSRKVEKNAQKMQKTKNGGGHHIPRSNSEPLYLAGTSSLFCAKHRANKRLCSRDSTFQWKNKYATQIAATTPAMSAIKPYGIA